MVRLKCDLPDGPALEEMVPRPQNTDTLRDMYRRWGFRGMLSELGQPNPGPVQTDLF